ncbi:hypothetical protein Hanom_Chr03g00199711 [Helianthus anomalus]
MFKDDDVGDGETMILVTGGDGSMRSSRWWQERCTGKICRSLWWRQVDTTNTSSICSSLALNRCHRRIPRLVGWVGWCLMAVVVSDGDSNGGYIGHSEKDRSEG